MLCVLAAVSCTRSETGAPDEGREVSLTASVEQQTARTWLDSSADEGVLPVYWSNGDRINVNGTTSSPLVVADGQKLASAAFKLKNVEAPYNVVYPASVFAGAAADGKCRIRIPATQQWKKGSFGEGAAILCGNGETDGPVTLKNVCGAIRVRLSDDDGDVIKSLVMTCLGTEALAGDFTLDYASGALSASESGKIQAITMTLPDEGVALDAAGTDFYFTIPAGTYAKGFLLRFEDARKHILRNYWLRESEGAQEGLTVLAGKLVSFPKAAYDPDGREICTPEDWQAFAAAYNSGNDGWKQDWLCKDGSIRLGADISAVDLIPINILTHKLDGCGHSITMSEMTSPLVRSIQTEEGKVCNLTIEGVNNPADLNLAAVFAGSIKTGGSIENCTNKAVFNITAEEKVVAAPFARDLYNGSVTGCVNEADVKVSVNIESGNTPVTVGGIVATVKALSDESLDGPCLIKDCVNKGAVAVTLVKPATSTSLPVCAGYGGILGTVLAGDETNFLLIDGCTNEGNVSLKLQNDPTKSNGGLSGTGGIVGLAVKLKSSGENFVWAKRGSTVLADVFESFEGIYFQMKDCVNKGNSFNGMTDSCSSDEPYKSFAGGLAGAVNGLKDLHSKIMNCRNLGSACPYDGSKYTRASLGDSSGGLAGYAGYADFSDCISKAAEIGTMKWQAYSASAGIGYVHLSFKMIRCKLFGKVSLIRATNYSQDNFSLGFGISSKSNSQGGVKPNILDLDGSEVTDCSFGGVISLSSNVVSYSATSGWGNPALTNITASNFEEYIFSPSAKVDYFYKAGGINGYNTTTSKYELDYHVLDKIPVTGSSYWDGTISD